MTDVPKDLINFGVRRQLDILRYGNSVVRDVMALLNDSEKEIIARIAARGETDSWTARRLKALFLEIGTLNYEAHVQAGRLLAKEMGNFARQESDATSDVIQSQVPASFSTVRPSDAQLAAIVSKEPITVGPDKKLLLEEIFQGLAASKEEAIRGAIRLGMVNGDTTDGIVRNLIGTRKAKYTDGIIERQRRGAAAIVRTVVNHTSNRAAQLTYGENSDLVKGWIFTATIDFRTTILCRNYSGQIYNIGQGPLPPVHVGCRSYSVPYLRTFRELGVDIDEMPVSTRASKDGQIRADITMDEWMRGQSDSDIKEMMGASRAKLFSEGKLDLKDFVSDKGTVYTLDELKARHKSLFERLFS